MGDRARLRRGSKRAMLREWKIANMPGFKARVEAGQHMDENGRELKFKRYADRKLLVMTGGDQHDPVLEWLHYDDVVNRIQKAWRSRTLRGEPREGWVSRGLVMRYGLDGGLEQRCWHTGVQLYLTVARLREELKWKVPWDCSREHLVCNRNGGYGNGDSNIVIAGRYFNKKIGHNPLPVKLYIRQRLAELKYDRDDPTWAAMGPILDHTIAIEDEHKLGDHYPWQPWAFAPGTREHRIAQAFHEEMLAAEAEFLALDAEGRADWVENFTWRW